MIKLRFPVSKCIVTNKMLITDQKSQSYGTNDNSRGKSKTDLTKVGLVNYLEHSYFKSMQWKMSTQIKFQKVHKVYKSIMTFQSVGSS